MKLIIPVAGESSRFPSTRPKWLLTHPDGNLMFFEAIQGLDLDEVDEVLLACREDHFQKYKVDVAVKKQLESAQFEKPYRIIQVPETSSQPETVAKCIERGEVKGPIFIKDSDNFVRAKIRPGNIVCTMDLNLVALIDAANKSYAEIDADGRITNIVEKHVISNTFCVGGYGFGDANQFVETYSALSQTPNLYVSHIIYQLISEGTIFEALPVSVFEDWGTLKEWNRFKRKHAVLFIDLDGTLVRNSAEMTEPYWGTTEGLSENIQVLRRLFDSGTVKVIITTSRKKRFEADTRRQMEALQIPFHEILFDVPHCQRILINDFSPTNPYRSADAINLPRDTEVLAHMLANIIDG